MPYRPTHNEHRLILARYILESIKEISTAFFNDPQFGSNSDQVLLCAAIFVGQGERKPMTAAKLAEYVGIPRATVIRKVKLLQERGLIQECAETKQLILTTPKLDSARMSQAVMTICTKLHEASRELSKLDT